MGADDEGGQAGMGDCLRWFALGRLMMLPDGELGVGGKRCGVAAPDALVADGQGINPEAARAAGAQLKHQRMGRRLRGRLDGNPARQRLPSAELACRQDDAGLSGRRRDDPESAYVMVWPSPSWLSTRAA